MGNIKARIYGNIILICFLCLSFNLAAQNRQYKIDTIYAEKLRKVKVENEIIFEITFGSINNSIFTKSKIIADSIQESINKHIPVIIKYNDNDLLLKMKFYKPKINQPSNKDRFIEEKINFNEPNNLKTNTLLTKFIPIDSIAFLFKYLKSLSCDISKQHSYDSPCITFQYKSNGCFARAHWMREIIEDDFHYYSDKIFSHGYLRAQNNSDCDKRCVDWGWHVAPIVYFNNKGAIDTFVLDPSICDKEVSIAEWKQKQEVVCKGGGKVDSVNIVTSDHYSWEYYKPENIWRYIYDNDDSDTKAFLNKYSNYCPRKKK